MYTYPLYDVGEILKLSRKVRQRYGWLNTLVVPQVTALVLIACQREKVSNELRSVLSLIFLGYLGYILKLMCLLRVLDRSVPNLIRLSWLSYEAPETN